MKYVFYTEEGEITSELETVAVPNFSSLPQGIQVLEVEPTVSAATHWINPVSRQAVAYSFEQSAAKANRPGFGFRWNELNKSWVDRLAATRRAQVSRAKEYPPIGDQLDALWKLFGPSAPSGSEAALLFGKIEQVKNKFPKG